MESIKIERIYFENKEGYNVIIGQSHFIKTVEDIYEAIVTASQSIKFGVAFNEASGTRLIRYDGNDDRAVNSAIDIAKRIGAGHVFCVVLTQGYPINILDRIKGVEEVVSLYISTANDFSVVIADDEKEGRGVLGVIDGKSPKGVEDDQEKSKRHKFLRDIGYKR